jgi:hypothetical protein
METEERVRDRYFPEKRPGVAKSPSLMCYCGKSEMVPLEDTVIDH